MERKKEKVERKGRRKGIQETEDEKEAVKIRGE